MCMALLWCFVQSCNMAAKSLYYIASRGEHLCTYSIWKPA